MIMISVGDVESNAKILQHICTYTSPNHDEIWSKIYEVENQLFDPVAVEKFLEVVELTDEVYGLLKHIMTIGKGVS